MSAALTDDQSAMLWRLHTAHWNHAQGIGSGKAFVAAPGRQVALRDLADQGLARFWKGEGADRGLLIGEITTAGLKAIRS